MMQLVAIFLFATLCILGLVLAPAALPLVIMMYPLEQLLQAAGGIFLSIPALANITVAAVAGFAVLRVITSQERPFLGYFNRALVVTLAIFAWSATSLLWTPSPEMGGQLISGGLPYFILFVVTAPMLALDVASLARVGRVLLLFGGAITAALVVNPEFPERAFCERFSQRRRLAGLQDFQRNFGSQPTDNYGYKSIFFWSNSSRISL